VIVRFGAERIDDARELSRSVAASDPEQEAALVVWRDGKEKTLHVTLARSELSAVAAAKQSGQAAGEALGLGLAKLDEPWRQRLGVPAETEGVVITRVEPGSPAALQGLRAGDIVSRIDTAKVDSVEDAVRAMAAAREHGEYATLLVRRGDAQRFVSVALS
jgi:serine protease Do